MIPQFCCLGTAFDELLGVRQILPAAALAPAQLGEVGGVILASGTEAEAARLLAAGAPRLLLGLAAIGDGQVITRLSERFGAERVGVCVAARPMVVSWSFETVSNADFKVVAPSLGAPTWEIVDDDGSGTGAHADWWLREMGARGATTFLLNADIRDDDDLNICAGLAEEFGDRLWLAPVNEADSAIADGIALAGLRQFALPPALFQRCGQWEEICHKDLSGEAA